MTRIFEICVGPKDVVLTPEEKDQQQRSARVTRFAPTATIDGTHNCCNQAISSTSPDKPLAWIVGEMAFLSPSIEIPSR